MATALRLRFRAPRVFLSYRRADTAGDTRGLYDRLAHEFGAERVFMDAEDGILAENFWLRIEREIRRSDFIVALVGPRWLVDLEGNRRLEDGDFVRREIATALQADIPIVPVTVSNGRMPRQEDLPHDIRPFALLDALALRDDGGFADDVAGLVRHLDRRLVSPRMLACIAATLLCVVMAWTRFLDGGVVAMEDVTAALGDMIAPAELADEIVLVTVTEETHHRFSGLGPFGSAWRELHARLVETITPAKPRAIVFDVSFRSSTEHDAVLANAMRGARAAGVPVFVAGATADGSPAVAPGLEDAASAVAMSCVGSRVARTWIAPIAAWVDDDRVAPRVRGSLALYGVFAPGEIVVPRTITEALVDRLIGSRPSVMLVGGPLVQPVTVEGSWDEHVVHEQACRGIASRDRVVNQQLRLSPLAALRSEPRRVAYEDVMDAVVPAARFTGKIVLIGRIGDPKDTHETSVGIWSEQRAGVELHADAMSNLLVRGASVRSINEVASVAFTMVMAAVGWKSRRRGGRTASLGVLLLVAAAAVAFAVGAYVVSPFVITLPYALAAFIAAYLVAGRPLVVRG